jgi:hypothetical protein
MLGIFAVTGVLFRLDQAAWQRDNGGVFKEYREWESNEVADFYESEGYPENGWLKILVDLQPGLWPVAVVTNPLPVYTRASWRHYVADVFSITMVWYLIGLYFDHRAASLAVTVR